MQVFDYIYSLRKSLTVTFAYTFCIGYRKKTSYLFFLSFSAYVYFSLCFDIYLFYNICMLGVYIRMILAADCNFTTLLLI